MAARAPFLSSQDVASLRVATGEALTVHRFEAVESVMSLFEVTVEVVSSDHDVDLAGIVGQRASLEVESAQGPGARRVWEGICRHAEHASTAEDGVSTYVIVIVPHLWALTQRRDYRVFQTMSELEIVIAILAEWGIEAHVRADAGSYPDRKYRVQFGESDFAFVSRMLEDAGISYHFDTGPDATTLILDDALHTRELRSGPLRHATGAPTDFGDEWAANVRVIHRPAPAAYTQRDVDYRRAPDFPLLASARRDAPGPLARAERFHYVPGAFVFRSLEPSATPVADDRGVHRTDLALGQRQVERRFDAKRSKARRVVFETTARDVRPGMLLRIADHPRAELGPDVTLLVTETRLAGELPGKWTQTVEARFTDVPYRPPMATPKPRATGVETATVVGAPGEEIHTDELGRVRVHFHWDRRGVRDDKSSCWLPVSQSWGGAGYGSVNLPRVGQEVLVDFMGGDVDRPIVTGRVYTSLQKLPWGLPANKTQSGLKSASSPATGGYNEIMFEDAAGKELMRLQAEKDRSTLVKNDCDSTIQRNRSTAVGNDEQKVVARDQSTGVRRHRSVSVDGDNQRIVGANDVTLVGGDKAEVTAGRRRLDTGHSYMSKVGNASSFIAMHEDFIIIQSKQVFINPGMDEAAILAALESGTPPMTADEAAAAQANADAQRQAALAARNDELQSRYDPTAPAEQNPIAAAAAASDDATTDVERAYHGVAADLMSGSGYTVDQLKENLTTQGGWPFHATYYGMDAPLSAADADAVIDRVIRGYP